jgi:hypothetical protein
MSTDTTRRARGGRAATKLLTVAALVIGAIVIVLPATASADSRVSLDVPCVAYANAGTTKYEGTGVNVIAASGVGVLSCHLGIVSGTPVTHPTTTSYGTCVLLELPGGRAELRCHYTI